MKMFAYNILGTRESIRRMLLFLMLLSCMVASAQIQIGGSVYGGGNEGDVSGDATVTLFAGNLNAVYGGARMADVGGRAFVNIDGENASGYILANYIYGGNDISGSIGHSNCPNQLTATSANEVDDTWNAFIRISTKTVTTGEGASAVVREAEGAQKIYIGQLFGGGNGYYTYATARNADGLYEVRSADNTTVIATSKNMFEKPELDRTYLELLGGSIVYAYGGGNNVTVDEQTVIYLDNPSKVVNSIKDPRITSEGEGELLTNARFDAMGVNTTFSSPSSDEFQIGRFFGGNNKAPMAIRPTWNLKRGLVRNLYSGGNAGAMTHPEGILLVVDSKDMVIDNIYGGCRMADVNPDQRSMPRLSGTSPNGTFYSFPEGYAARLLIAGGDINNVYGGNDITGDVKGGNAVGIHSNIRGNVYGGGNGSYPYTDNSELQSSKTYGDLYYPTVGFNSSVEALNAFRPNAEQVSVRLVGTASKPTVIHGAVYCGGNSATLKGGALNKAELKIGSYVYADSIFLGNNGEHMVEENILKHYAKSITEDAIGNVTIGDTGIDFSSMNLASNDPDSEGKTTFDKYMEGAAMWLMPKVDFDSVEENGDPEDYVPYSTYIGSLYCGGNRGSLIREGKISIDFDDKVIIYNKVVGGCNNANIPGSDYNAPYEGGVLGAADANSDKLELNFEGLKIQPKRWVVERDGNYEVIKDAKGKVTYKLQDGNPYLEWNTIYASTGKETEPVTAGGEGENSSANDLDRRLIGGNIYGGCDNSGHVNGNVIINLDASVVDRKGKYAVFDSIQINVDEGEAILYNNENYKIVKRRSGVILDEQGMDVLGKALNVFGGGYGAESEIWGSTTINLNAGYTFQIFGGGERGAIGKGVRNATTKKLEYSYDPKYSCYINLKDKNGTHGTYRGDKDNSDGYVDSDDMAEAEFIYGGGFFGTIAGNTRINLGNGRVFNTFAGSCNADILGHTETYVGRNTDNDNDQGYPWIRDHIYGGNDLGGRILGEEATSSDAAKADCDFSGRVSTTALPMVYKYNASTNPKPDVLKASAYIEYIQGRVVNIFGGCYGSYNYTDRHFKDYTNDDGTDKEGFTKPRMGNAFVNFRPNNDPDNKVAKIFGAGQGYEDEKDMNKLQNSSYVLIDVPQTLLNFKDTRVFGAGSYGGLGMNVYKAQAVANLDKVSAVIDLVRGNMACVYGGSWNEGFTRRTVVNVPVGSTIALDSIFGGAYGADPLIPCDVYEANVNYHSENATVRGNIYGGNNYADRTLYGKVNVSVPVWQNKTLGYLATVYGAGHGEHSWSQYTEVNLNAGAKVGYVYGGGEDGKVLNLQTVNKWHTDDPALDLTLGADYVDYGLDIPEEDVDAYLVKRNGLGKLTNTNVYINKGAVVGAITVSPEGLKTIGAGYAFGGGYGPNAIVSGTTYIGLHGGELGKDLYGGGYGGSVHDEKDVAKDDNPSNDFVAGTNAYIEGGTLRKVFGGGYEGHVGKHEGEVVDGKQVAVAGSPLNDIPGETNVVIGIRKDQVFPEGYVYDNSGQGDSLNYYKGVPAIQWNAYGAGEGGSVFGTSHLTLNNGYVGYDYKGTVSGRDIYEPKLDNETVAGTAGKGQLKDYGSVFGAGYDDKSSSDYTDVKLYGGVVRGSLYGGGEISTVGRGRTGNLSGTDRLVTNIYLPGSTHIEMYNGHVLRHVFGGGKGYNLYGYGGSNELYTDGYVFGKTEVYIRGGEVGTQEGLAEGYGNVFGGGDIGFVYGVGFFDQFTKAERTANVKGTTGSPNHWYYYASYRCKEAYGPYRVGDLISDSTYTSLPSTEQQHWNGGKDTNNNDIKYLTEDSKVVVSPWLQVRNSAGTTINGHFYPLYAYVPTEDLNTLKRNAAEWGDLFTGDKLANGDTNPADPIERGVQIRNAVFAGGNVSSNSDQTYANAKTIYGNSTATLFDVYHRDFITVGTEHTGGLYGGGNLSVVDGYRELNITNYGTDYYGLNSQITLEEYRKLTNRERAYFQLEYLCQQSYDKYTAGESRISEEEYNKLDNTYKNTTYWEQYGFCSIYAGRLLNTIQRADLCGVFGSRLVLQGAKDRVADVGDNTVYTINRIGELSLNKQISIVPGETTGDDAEHGNYFGIYSVVNYLGHLTSDVKFTDPYCKWNKETRKAEIDNNYTYYSWKLARLKYRDRNNGTCHNQVALASGVFLEITTEYSTQSKKVYGDITGIIELDLINVKRDIEGGGYVYARNEHGTRSDEHMDFQNVILSSYNMKDVSAGRAQEARTYKRYTYNEDIALLDHETSGNFIHKSKRIVDDCYPHNGVYAKGYEESPAHYWYIKGEVYIYDREVSAYAGSATAYMKEVNLPLTISAASDGKLQLLNVKPNLYAYYSDEGRTTRMGEDGVKVNNESETYHLNDVITWWDWNQLESREQKYFVTETFVNVEPCTIGSTDYPTGTYVTVTQPTLESFAGKTVLDNKGNEINTAEGIASLFRSSNNISHENGYVLTFDMDSPTDWNDWYSLVEGTSTYTVTDGNVTTDRLKKEQYAIKTDSEKADYREGPTFRLKAGQSPGLYGQKEYKLGEILTEEVYNDYNTTLQGITLPTEQEEAQASAERAYVAKESFGSIQAGNPISTSDFDGSSDAVKAHYEKAMVCTGTIQLGENEFVLMGELVAVKEDDVNETELNALATKYKDYNNSKQNADPIDDDQALEYVKARLSKAYYCTKAGLYGGQYYETDKNYSAIKSWCTLSKDDRMTKFDFNYDAFDVLSDSEYLKNKTTEQAYHAPYSDVKPVEYSATYNGTLPFTYYDEDNTSHTISEGATTEQKTITREAYEKIRNEQRDYTPIVVPAGSDYYTAYIATATFVDGGTPVAQGEDVTEKYSSLSEEGRGNVISVSIQKESSSRTVYYHYKGTGSGNVIEASAFNALPNDQKDFIVQGKEPMGTITLYVSRQSSAKDVMSEKVITVVYQYTYFESDEDSNGSTQVNELHVLNIHLNLESGVPEIGLLSTPSTVLPGSKVGLSQPSVNPGLYEPRFNGWEMYTSEMDAEMHRNGQPFTNNSTRFYWYQNQKVYVAFYTVTELGYTYSNYVPISVANYHDLSEVMADTEHHMYVDDPTLADPQVRAPKIYIDQNRKDENQLDLLKKFYDMSKGETVDGATLNTTQVGNCKNLDFILKSNLDHAGSSWTPLGDDEGHCFEGTLHGDGYTISGLDNSLFNHLCGNVFNLGVTGSFTGAGIAEEGSGYMENCWISTTYTGAKSTNPVFGNPTGTDASRPYRIVNCYYQEEDDAANQYPNTSTYGKPTRADARAFYNGTVAYNLNGFYLNKRYHDKQYEGTESPTTNSYYYLPVNKSDNTLPDNLKVGYYPVYTGEVAKYGYLGYVEDRYNNEDFLYANGTIPEQADIRLRSVMVGDNPQPRYAPIWPEDYLFFGQMLTYGYGTQAHQSQPSHLTKVSGRLPQSDLSNRVYRAPAYFRSKVIGSAHFNPNAYLAAYSYSESVTGSDRKPAYPFMTAIDFAGHEEGTAKEAYKQGLNGKLFYQPLLDDDGLTSINSNGQTKNLLVYAPANGKTYNVLSAYFIDPALSESQGDYRCVATANTGEVVGHLVLNSLLTSSDHLLVDKQDFNCPIRYQMGANSRMWYQRLPDNNVTMASGVTTGWEDICLPFTAELVTTQDKGEITHFYQGSENGHEYWLREFTGILSASGDELVGNFTYPAATGTTSKNYKNTFLWDYYYSKGDNTTNAEDTHGDSYQKADDRNARTYYSQSRTYENYPLLQSGTPYLVGFPGSTYYEFDLSGSFQAKNTADNPAKLDKQRISFVSAMNVWINVSDDEQKDNVVKVTENGNDYFFCPTYVGKELPVDSFLLKSDGSKYEKLTAVKSATPFRPYFVKKTASAGTRSQDGLSRTDATRTIAFSNEPSTLKVSDMNLSDRGEDLLVSGGKKKIAVESQLRYTADVRIVTPAGITLKTFTIQPTEYVETRVETAGVYIVEGDEGRYVKKVIVR